MYLKNPAPLPVNSNPGMVFPPRKFTTVLDVARFAARLLDAMLNFKSILDNKKLPVDRARSCEKGQPLCMAQYYRLLGSCRLPGKTLDSQYISSLINNNCPHAHIVVVCRNQFYNVPLLEKGIRLSEDEICAQLLHILNEAPCLENSPPVGLLTTWKRPLWAEARKAISMDEKNQHILEIIERALLVLCLDEPLPDSFNSRLSSGRKGHSVGCRDETNLALQMLHGGGSSHNSGNRWFDKSIQLIISGDGACGLSYEHSFAEGGPVIAMVQKLMDHADSLPANSEVPVCRDKLNPPAKLNWVLESDNIKHIEEAATAIDCLVNDLDFKVYRFDSYGRDFMKTCGLSPDAFIQLALQLAYYRLHGKLTATYESASLTRFLQGRVDCIRSASPEALRWVKTMIQPNDDYQTGNKKVTFHLISTEEKLKLWKEAATQQMNETKDNILGRGMDLHLLGLREASKETSPTASHPLPKIFTDQSFSLANKFLLSTSQVCTTGDSFMGYGPVEPDGYGCSYNPKSDHVIFCISAFWSSKVTSACKFAQSLEESLNAMYNLLNKTPK